MISEATLANMRSVALRMNASSTCRIYSTQGGTTSTAFGQQRSPQVLREVPSIPGDDATAGEVAFWANLGIPPGTTDFPCKIYPTRANELKLMDISADKNMVFFHLPWYFIEVDEYRVFNGVLRRWVSQLGEIEVVAPVPLGRFKVEEILESSPGRAYLRILATQRQDT